MTDRVGVLSIALAAAGLLACGRDARRTTAEAPSAEPSRNAPAPPRAALPATDSTVPRVPESGDPRDRGAIRIVFASNGGGALGEFIATLLLTDPQGRRTGFDPASGDTLREIPRGWYDDEVIEDPMEEGSGAATRGIEITAPEAGAYTLTVRATVPGTYELSIRGYDVRLEPSGRSFSHVPITAGTVHTYLLNFAPDSGVTVAVAASRPDP